MSIGTRFISIQNVSKRFGNVTAVDDVCIDIQEGEFFSLLGPSGCGKTTLLRMLAGFETPSGGEIYVDGRPMSGVPPNRRPTNMVFQNYAIFPHLNVSQNIAYGLRNQGLSKRAIAEAVEAGLQQVRLANYGGRRADQLSGGQRQRVALARALVCRPKVLLLDEPLGALDRKLREEMQLELRELQRAVGITFVFVTHDQEEALAMSDRIAVMAKGKVLQIDTAAQLYEAPNCRAVASFIGSMNFIDGYLFSVGEGCALIDVGKLGKLKVRLDGALLPPVGPVTLAIRPEKLRVVEAALSDVDNRLPARLVARTYLGDRRHYYVQVEGFTKLLTVAAQSASRHIDDRGLATKPLWVTWSSEDGLLLPPEEGRE